MAGTKYTFNPFTSNFDAVPVPGYIPEVGTDPTNAPLSTAWVLRTNGGGGGKLEMLFGLGVPITQHANYTYQLSFRTMEEGIKRVTLS